MYVGFVDGSLLFCAAKEAYCISAGEITTEINAAATFEFKLPPINKARGKIMPRKSVISVEQDGKEIFRGTVRPVGKDFFGNISYTAEDLLSSLDNIQGRPYGTTTVARRVELIVNTYNAGAEADKQLALGNVTVGGNFTVGHQAEYVSMLDMLKEVVAAKGGYVRLRYESGLVYLDYLEEIEEICTQEIRFSENLIDIDEQIDTDTIVTRVFPEGKDGLTIESVNDGVPYILNAEAEEKYGRIDKTISVDSDDPAIVKQYGQAYATRYAAEQNTFTLTAQDMSVINKSLDSFEVAQRVRALSPPHGIDAIMRIYKCVKNIVDQNKSRITLGAKLRTLTQSVQDASRAAAAAAETVEFEKIDFSASTSIRNSSVAARYYEKQHRGHIRLYCENAVALTAGQTYTLGTIEASFAPSARSALAVFCSKQGCAMINQDGEIVFKPYENISTGYSIYINGDYIAK